MSAHDLSTLTQIMDLRVSLINARTHLREACRNLGLSDDDSAAPDAPTQVAGPASSSRHCPGGFWGHPQDGRRRMSASVSVEDLEWLAGEYGGLLASVHGDRCISDGPEHCCTKEQARADGIFGAISSLLERAEVAELALTDLRPKIAATADELRGIRDFLPNGHRVSDYGWALDIALNPSPAAGGASTPREADE